MKKIIAEYPFEFTQSSYKTAIFRFNCPFRTLNPTSIKYKPVSGYTEVSIPFPSKNISAMRQKIINSNFLSFKAFPENPKYYYYARINDNKLILTHIQCLYLFEPMHQYYNCDYQCQSFKKAQSREELEHRRKSINFKLSLIENESFINLEYDGASSLTDQRFNLKKCESNEVLQAESVCNSNKEHYFITQQNPPVFNQQIQPVDFIKIEKTIKNARIVNFKDLVDIFENKAAITSVLFKMADCVCGRYVLKNIYYEKKLWPLRDQLISLFKTKGEISISETRFLGEENWLAEELCEIKNKKYVLKGFKESMEFDTEKILEETKERIKSSLKIEKMQHKAYLSKNLNIEEEIISNILKSEDFLHLINNCYALNDPDFWFTPALKLFISKKSIEIEEIEKILEEHSCMKNHDLLQSTLKVFCTHRGTKYNLKQIKD